jgi:hypothetical protein
VFNGTTWEPIDAAEFKLKGITQTYLSTTEPGNQSGYYWKNTSTSDVSGVKAGDTVYFNSDLGIWISTSKTISQSLYIGLDTAKPSNMLEGNLYLTSNIIDGGNKLYNAKNGTWVAFASFAAGEIGTSKPAKTLTVTRYLQLAKVITKTPQSLPVYYYRNTTSDAWSIASTYDKKLIKSTSIPNKV